LEVYLENEDIFRWENLNPKDFIPYIQVEPKCISFEGLAGYHIEENNILLKMEKELSKKDFTKRLNELSAFILNTHAYIGKGIPLPIYTFIEEIGRNPILIPKSFEIIKRGQEMGLVYMIRLGYNGHCPFLKNRSCSIHEIKPKACSQFPLDEDGNFREDENIIKICKSLKNLHENKKRKKGN
ncbi:MAG: hypothetical protein GF383_08395, partial [Candidatus Lokiarchaeota archaeon]|nr:hypothetical protein [Candidatus Lokiarchaeota archaeon]MBD3340375.1 hypothetical protein [Candidatus Lokiarchaeota archaeon]